MRWVWNKDVLWGKAIGKAAGKLIRERPSDEQNSVSCPLEDGSKCEGETIGVAECITAKLGGGLVQVLSDADPLCHGCESCDESTNIDREVLPNDVRSLA